MDLKDLSFTELSRVIHFKRALSMVPIAKAVNQLIYLPSGYFEWVGYRRICGESFVN